MRQMGLTVWGMPVTVGNRSTQFASISRRHLLLARRVSLVASAGAIALLVVGSPFTQNKVLADQFTQQIQSLSAQANALSHAIASMNGASSAALGNALASAQAIANTQAKLGQAQTELDRANQNLANTTAQIQTVQSEYTADQSDLGQILKHVYELTDDGSVTAILVDSKSFIDAMDALTSADQVSARVKQLVTQIQGTREQLSQLQKQQIQDQQHANTLVSTLQSLAGQQQGEEIAYRQEASSLKGKAAASRRRRLLQLPPRLGKAPRESSTARFAPSRSVRSLTTIRGDSARGTSHRCATSTGVGTRGNGQPPPRRPGDLRAGRRESGASSSSDQVMATASSGTWRMSSRCRARTASPLTRRTCSVLALSISATSVRCTTSRRSSTRDRLRSAAPPRGQRSGPAAAADYHAGQCWIRSPRSDRGRLQAA